MLTDQLRCLVVVLVLEVIVSPFAVRRSPFAVRVSPFRFGLGFEVRDSEFGF